MTPKDQATKRPWSVDGFNLTAIITPKIEDGIKGWHVIAKCVDHDGNYHESIANAGLIVKAVNCHEELTEACRQAISALEDYAIKPLEEYERIDVIDFIKQALAKAGDV